MRQAQVRYYPHAPRILLLDIRCIFISAHKVTTGEVVLCRAILAIHLSTVAFIAAIIKWSVSGQTRHHSSPSRIEVLSPIYLKPPLSFKKYSSMTFWGTAGKSPKLVDYVVCLRPRHPAGVGNGLAHDVQPYSSDREALAQPRPSWPRP